jgi:hypothetical protein
VLVNLRAERPRRLATVRIGAAAWPVVVGSLTRYEIIDVHVKPELHEDDGPPGHDALVIRESGASEAASNRQAAGKFKGIFRLFFWQK